MTESVASLIASLANSELGLSEVTRLVTEAEKTQEIDRIVKFGLSANVTIDLLATFLRKQAILHGHRAQIQIGNFDDHVGNVNRFALEGVDAVVLSNVFDALMPAFEARVPLLGDDVISAQATRLGDELTLVLTAAQKFKHVFVPLLHSLHPPHAGFLNTKTSDTIARFNDVIRSKVAQFENVQLIDSGALASLLGWSRAHDMRSYRRFRAPFSAAYFDGFAEQMYRLTRGFGSYFYKALVLDCDNTLWGGVIGEDLASGIKLGPHGHPASVFWELQHEFLALQHRGVLLCLCTKNEPADINAMLSTHPDMVLREEHFVLKCVNWDDKVKNLQRISSELNIGLDALVFIDDSPFECEAVRGQLPMVKTLQVPSDLSTYPRLATQLKELFAIGNVAEESAAKTEQYRLRARATDARAEFTTQEEYLASLELKVTLRRNERAAASRIAELTQKSNQFNLTTRRYTDNEIRGFMESSDTAVYSIHVADKFGDSGLTGVVIMDYAEQARIDEFLLSCRILGRDIEVSFWNLIFEAARVRGLRTVSAEYIPTPKNAQVQNFWSRLGFELVSSDPGGHRKYIGDLSSLNISSPSYLEVHHVF